MVFTLRLGHFNKKEGGALLLLSCLSGKSWPLLFEKTIIILLQCFFIIFRKKLTNLYKIYLRNNKKYDTITVK